MICDKLFKNKDQENRHFLFVHQNDLQCDKCKVTFETFRSFNDHLTECMEEPKKFTCKQCKDDYVWYSTKTLERHWVEEHKLHKAVCEICGSQERCKIDLKNHIMRHNKTSEHQCHHCGKSLSDPTMLIVHLQSVHGENTFIHKCHCYQKEYLKHVTLKSHINAKHEQTTRYQWDECPFSNWYPKCLKAHVNVKHKNYRTVTCDYCEERF